MAEITLSSAVRNNLLSLQNTADLLGKTQQRLATGLKVNSALDDPTAFFTASSLNSRANDLNRLLDGVGNSIQTIRAADNGISAITNLVESAQATARQAQQAAAGSSSNVATVTSSSVIADDTAAVATGGQTIADDTATVINLLSGTAETTELNALGIANGDSFTIQLNGEGAVTVNFDDTGGGLAGDTITLDRSAGGDTLASLEAALNGHADFTAGNIAGTTGLQITGANASGGIEVIGGNANVLSNLGLSSAANADNTGTNTYYYDLSNSDLQNGVVGGAPISGAVTFNIGGETDTIRFGLDDAAGEVSTKAELEAAITALNSSNNTGATFYLSDANGITVTAGSADDGDITVTTVGANVQAQTGFAASEVAERTNATLATLVANTRTLTISDGTNTDTLTFGNGAGEITNKAELATQLAAISTSGATGSITAGNKIQLVGAEGETLTIGGSGTNAAAITLGLALSTAPSVTVGSQERQDLEDEFNNLRTQIDQLANDASFNGNNLLTGDNLKVTFNEDGSSSLSVTGVTFTSSGLGISAAASGSFQSDANIDTILTGLDTAIATLRSQASTFGSNLSVTEIRQEFTKNLINTLETGAGNLTLADSNEEGANLLALQTRQQLSSVALSLASQSDQNVLRLF